MSVCIDVPHFEKHGWVRIEQAVLAALCRRLVEVIEREMHVPVHDPARWHEHGAAGRDLIPIWGHQAQWDIRQHPNLHRIFATLWRTEELHVSLDSCRFTPAVAAGLRPAVRTALGSRSARPDAFLQGVLALTDTKADQGGFCCVPSLYRDRAAWPKLAVIDADGDENWLADTTGRDIVHVPAGTGDLIVWDSRLPHGNSKNHSARPRLAFYVLMGPQLDATRREIAIQSWRTGQCVPWWRSRPGYDRIEPWPPAQLSPLGRRLLGLDPWPES